MAHAANPIRLYRSRPGHLRNGNFGDEITAAILDRILGVSVNHVPMRRAELIGAGSILDSYWRHFMARPWRPRALIERALPSAHKLHVWGSGAMLEKSRFDWPQQLHIHAVRGKLTAARIENFNGPIGDPGILASRLVNAAPRTDTVVLVPHFVDESYVDTVRLPDGWRVCHTDASLDQVLASISSARLVVSSSLHGLITADSFGIPCIWAASRAALAGNSTYKFLDYQSSRYAALGEPLTYEELWRKSGTDLEAMATTAAVPIPEWQETLLAAFPSELLAD